MFRTVLLIWVSGAFACLTAFADIPRAEIEGFEAAKQTSQRSLIIEAANKLAAAATAHPEDPQAGRYAYEAGWTLCLVQRCADALAPGAFAAGRADAPADAGVLKPFADYRSAPTKKKQKALNAALAGVEKLPPTGLTLSAFRELYDQAMLNRDYKSARDWASRASVHLINAGDDYTRFRIEADIVAINADFAIKRDVRQQTGMADMHGELERLKLLSPKPVPDWIESSYWQTKAWLIVISANLEADGKERLSGDEIEARLASHIEGVQAIPDPDEEAEAALPPVCKGEIRTKNFRQLPVLPGGYNHFGAFIVRFRLEQGEVVDPRIVAFAPRSGTPGETAESRIDNWKFVPLEDAAATGCRLDQEKATMIFVVRMIW
jgi:hypothetical protein